MKESCLLGSRYSLRYLRACSHLFTPLGVRGEERAGTRATPGDASSARDPERAPTAAPATRRRAPACAQAPAKRGGAPAPTPPLASFSPSSPPASPADWLGHTPLREWACGRANKRSIAWLGPIDSARSATRRCGIKDFDERTCLLRREGDRLAPRTACAKVMGACIGVEPVALARRSAGSGSLPALPVPPCPGGERPGRSLPLRALWSAFGRRERAPVRP